MLNLKNNFLWKFMANANLQNPVKKFDEVWEETNRSIKKAGKLFKSSTQKSVEPKRNISFFKPL